jgi:DNA-binding MarR family transcriptional regulator/GNAT superfamily N-acetyltransferase
MAAPNPDLIDEVRRASRHLVREFGFLNQTLAGTDLSGSGVHAIVEIGRAAGLTAKALAETLMLEKSTVSRLVRGLGIRGLIEEVRSPEDGRAKLLQLTGPGRALLSRIDRYAVSQVLSAMAALDDQRRATIRDGLKTYACSLRAARLGCQTRGGQFRPFAVEQGYAPGLIGAVVRMHAAYYAREFDFGSAFESKVAGGLAEFIPRLERGRNAVWRAVRDGLVIGAIAIDGDDLDGNYAHLRWFIVDDGLRGSGVGRALIETALAFVDAQGFDETRLWTFEGLDAARALYERHGFTLEREYPGDQWGVAVNEQVFVRRRTA